MIVVGIDPGRKGAVVGIGPEGPIIVRRANGPQGYRQESTPDPAAMQRALVSVRGALSGVPDLVLVEAPAWHARGGARMAAGSAGRSGMEHGAWRGLLTAMGWPYFVIRAQEWRKAAGITVPRGSDPKQATIRVVRALLPTLELVPAGCRVPHDGIADAAGLALAALGGKVRR